MPWSEHWITLVIFHFPREDGHPSRNDLYTRARMFQWVFGLQICSSWQVAKVPKRSPSIFGEITLWPWSRQHAARGGAVDAWDAANLPGRSGTQQQFGSPSHLLHRPSLGVLGGHDTRHETRGSCHAAPRPKVRH